MSPAPVALDSYDSRIGALLRRLSDGSPFKLHDASDLYGLHALAEFLQYEIDGSFQTDVNEYMVQPFCLVFVCPDAIAGFKAEDPERAIEVIRAMGAAFGKVTRKADRAARFGVDFVTLLRRTSPRSIKESYVSRVTEPLVAAALEAGLPTTLSFGIAGHPDSAVKGVEDLFLKAIYALEEARRLGPGSVVAYDVRSMPAMSDAMIRKLTEEAE